MEVGLWSAASSAAFPGQHGADHDDQQDGAPHHQVHPVIGVDGGITQERKRELHDVDVLAMQGDRPWVGDGVGVSLGLDDGLAGVPRLELDDPVHHLHRGLVRAVIDAGGHVRDVAVAQGLGLGLDERAIAAVEKWKFRAGMRNGKPVATAALIQLSFRLL
jgi:TonB family protein